MKNKALLLCALLMVGCSSGNNTSSSSAENSRTNYNSSSSSVVDKTSSEVSSSSEKTSTSSDKTSNTSSSSVINDDPTPTYDNANNLVDMEKVLNLQCSKGTAYGGQYCTGDNNGYYGSWYCDWEGWWCEYTQSGDYGVNVVSPTNCTYSGEFAWKVQLNVPYAEWQQNKTYKFAFDLRSTVDTEGTDAPVVTEDINVDLLNKEGTFLFTIGTFKATNTEYTHYEYEIATAADLTAENYITLSLGGRGHLNYEFRNLYLADVTE